MARLLILLVIVFVYSFSGGKGIGVVFFSINGGKTDSTTIYKQPKETSNKLATYRIIFAADEMGYQYSVTNPKYKAIAGQVEYGYEISGMPIDSIDETKSWVQVTIVFQELNIISKGWIKVKNSNMDYLEWKNILPKRSVLFFDPFPKSIEFYDSMEGKLVHFNLEHYNDYSTGQRRYNYVLHPLEAKGVWMKVKVVTPSDFCDQPKAPRSKILWIKYLDEKGKPLIFYPTRGC